MILPQTYMQSLILMIVSLVCLGSWAVTYKLVGRWRFELYYIDFALGAVIAGVIYAATTGSLGFDGFALGDDMGHAGKRQWMFALIAGGIFNLGNMLMVAAISVAGMSVAMPVALGLALIFGTGLRQLMRKEIDSTSLLLGLALILAAIVLVSVAYAIMVGARRKTILSEAKEAGKKPSNVPTSGKALILAIAGGLVMALYVYVFAKSQGGELGLGPYSRSMLFCLGMFVSAMIFTVFFANLPVEGEPIEITKYFKGKIRTHFLGILGGVLFTTGIFAAAVAAGTEEIARLTPGTKSLFTFGVPALGALWGLLVWREFREASGGAKIMAVLMVLLLAGGAVLIALAPPGVKLPAA